MNPAIIKLLKELKEETPEQTDIKTLSLLIVENTNISNRRGLHEFIGMLIMIGALVATPNKKVFTLNQDVIGRLIGESKA
jgi:hypothetical protein